MDRKDDMRRLAIQRVETPPFRNDGDSMFTDLEAAVEDARREISAAFADSKKVKASLKPGKQVN